MLGKLVLRRFTLCCVCTGRNPKPYQFLLLDAQRWLIFRWHAATFHHDPQQTLIERLGDKRFTRFATAAQRAHRRKIKSSLVNCLAVALITPDGKNRLDIRLEDRRPLWFACVSG